MQTLSEREHTLTQSSAPACHPECGHAGMRVGASEAASGLSIIDAAAGSAGNRGSDA